MRHSFYICGLAATIFFSAPAIAGPFEDFFQPSPAVTSEDVIPAKVPRIISVNNDLDTNVRRYWEQGYKILGVSEFVGAFADPKKAIKKAKKTKG